MSRCQIREGIEIAVESVRIDYSPADRYEPERYPAYYEALVIAPGATARNGDDCHPDELFDVEEFSGHGTTFLGAVMAAIGFQAFLNAYISDRPTILCGLCDTPMTLCNIRDGAYHYQAGTYHCRTCGAVYKFEQRSILAEGRIHKARP